MKKTKTSSKTKEIKVINRQFERVTLQLHEFRDVCRDHGSPVKAVTFRVLDNGETRCHVTYSKKEQ